MTTTRQCRYCGQPVTSSVLEVDYCEACYYGGVHHSDRLYSFLRDLDSPGLDGPMADVHHAGGGFFVVQKTLADGSEVVASGVDGDNMPDSADGPWLVCRYTAEEAEHGGEGTTLVESGDRAAVMAAFVDPAYGPWGVKQ